MTIKKSILYTISFIIIIELISLWILLIPIDNNFTILILNSRFINALIQFSTIVALFIIFKQSYLLKIKSTNYKFYILAIILGILYPYFQTILNIFYYLKLPSDDLFSFDFSHLNSLNIIAAILIGPITEELFFRNFIQGRFQKTKSIIFSIVFTSILFAFIHIPFASLFFNFLEFSFHQAYIAFFGGLISGILFLKSKSIGPSIIFHIFWNFIVHISQFYS